MDNERIVLRAALCLVDPAAGVGIQRIRAETVDRLGRNAEQAAPPDDLRRLFDIFLCIFRKQNRIHKNASFCVHSCCVCSFFA